MSNLISSLSASIKFYNYKVNALCVVGTEAATSGMVHFGNAVNKEALAILDYCNCLREAKKLLKEDKKLKLEMSALYGKALCLSQESAFLNYYQLFDGSFQWSTYDYCEVAMQPKQQIDAEDEFVSMEKIKSLNIDAYFAKACYFKFKNSKSKSKWSRSGKTTRVLSNR